MKDFFKNWRNHLSEEVHKVQPGENLTKIAKMKGTTVQKLKDLNPSLDDKKKNPKTGLIGNPDHILVGQTIRIPEKGLEDPPKAPYSCSFQEIIALKAPNRPDGEALALQLAKSAGHLMFFKHLKNNKIQGIVDIEKRILALQNNFIEPIIKMISNLYIISEETNLELAKREFEAKKYCLENFYNSRFWVEEVQRWTEYHKKSFEENKTMSDGAKYADLLKTQIKIR